MIASSSAAEWSGERTLVCGISEFMGKLNLQLIAKLLVFVGMHSAVLKVSLCSTLVLGEDAAHFGTQYESVCCLSVPEQTWQILGKALAVRVQ